MVSATKRVALEGESNRGRWQVDVVLFGLEDQDLATSAGIFAQTADPDLSNNVTDEANLPEDTTTSTKLLDSAGDSKHYDLNSQEQTRRIHLPIIEQ